MRASPLLVVLGFAAPAFAQPAHKVDARTLPITIAQQLHDAVKTGDVRAIAAHLQAPLRYEGIVFDDAGCARAFKERGTVSARKLGAFAACLAGQPSIVDADLRPAVDDGSDPELTVGNDARLYLLTARTGRKQVTRIIRVEADSQGGEEGVEGGVAGGVVGVPPPPPPPPPRFVPLETIRKMRIAGVDKVEPDAATIKAMGGQTRLVAIAKVCFDATGVASSATVIKSSGYPAYDDALRAALLGWTIKPYTYDGKGVPVCTAITFMYLRR